MTISLEKLREDYTAWTKYLPALTGRRPHPHCSIFAESNFSRYFLRTAEHNLVGNAVGLPF
jgi:hypothetical protein